MKLISFHEFSFLSFNGKLETSHLFHTHTHSSTSLKLQEQASSSTPLELQVFPPSHQASSKIQWASLSPPRNSNLLLSLPSCQLWCFLCFVGHFLLLLLLRAILYPLSSLFFLHLPSFSRLQALMESLLHTHDFSSIAHYV